MQRQLFKARYTSRKARLAQPAHCEKVSGSEVFLKYSNMDPAIPPETTGGAAIAKKLQQELWCRGLIFEVTGWDYHPGLTVTTGQRRLHTPKDSVDGPTSSDSVGVSNTGRVVQTEETPKSGFVFPLSLSFIRHPFCVSSFFFYFSSGLSTLAISCLLLFLCFIQQKPHHRRTIRPAKKTEGGREEKF